jgi:hypothetical protein
MTNRTAEHRLHEVFSAFNNLKLEHQDLSAVAQSVDHRASRCTVLVRSATDGAQVQLDILTAGAHLVARSGTSTDSVGRAAIEDQLTVNLAETYAWDDAIFASADEMAFYLLKHMRRRLVAVADLKSADPS